MNKMYSFKWEHQEDYQGSWAIQSVGFAYFKYLLELLAKFNFAVKVIKQQQ